MTSFVGGYDYRAITAGNTKVRRLGYLYAISCLIPVSVVALDVAVRRLCSWAEEQSHTLQLQEYGRQRDLQGALVPRSEDGARRYVEVASSLGVVAHVEGGVALTTYGRLWREVSVRREAGNCFLLTPVESLLAAYWLLLHDADMLIPVMELSLAASHVGDVQRRFQRKFDERLQNKINACEDERVQEKLRGALKRVRNWRSPERYAENLVPPRANWLLDLGLMDERDFRLKVYSLNKNGQSLLSAIKTTSASELPDVKADWLWSEGFEVIWKAVSQEKRMIPWCNMSEEQQNANLGSALQEGMECFPLLGMQASSLFPTLVYSALRLLAVDSTLATPSQLLKWMNSRKTIAGLAYRTVFSGNDAIAYISRGT
jgi:hypothetical protein